MATFSTKHIIHLLAVALIVLPGCAAKGNSMAGMKVGLHIDAVLEFVVEYPLEWTKDRRLEYGRDEGEIRWSHPTQSETLLQVTSHLREHRTYEQALERALSEYPDLTDALQEQVELPAGEALRVSGQTAHQHVDIYLLIQPSRTYVIALKASLENFSDYEDLMEEITQSFQRIVP